MLTEVPDLSNCTLLTDFAINDNNLTKDSVKNIDELMPESINSAPDWKVDIGIGPLLEDAHREVVSDGSEKIIISGNLDENVQTKGEMIEDISQYQHIIDEISKEITDIKDISIYDIYLYEENNNNTVVKVQPNGSVEVKIKIQYDNYKYHV